MAFKVLIVDDEPHIRMILKTVITRNTSFEVVAECDNMADALLAFNEKKPQVVFMDIEINGGSGVDCAKVMAGLNPDVKIIFATAHSEYMANAFELYAFDYLVKPFNVSRIEHTLERLEKSVHDTPLKSKLIIKGKETTSFIDVSDIVMIERINNLTYIYGKTGEEHITSLSLADIEPKLDDNIFVRSHKSYIINVSMIKCVEQYGRWTFSVSFKGIDKCGLITKEKYDFIKSKFE